MFTKAKGGFAPACNYIATKGPDEYLSLRYNKWSGAS